MDFPTESRSSPRAWGCFSVPTVASPGSTVFPTCVGVFLDGIVALAMALSLPHVRGGVSKFRRSEMSEAASSPRAWGCFRTLIEQIGRYGVFPTCVGVFLI